MHDPTPMERHLDAVPEPWTAVVKTPKHYEGCVSVAVPCWSLTEARAEVAAQITELRQEEARIADPA